MDAKLVAKYLVALREKSGLTLESIAEKSGRSEATVKNLCSGKTEDPRLDTVAPVIYAMGGSIDEMYTGNSKDAVKEISVNPIKEIYEQHLKDYKDHTEHRLADKREIIEQQKEHIKTLKKELTSSKIFAMVGYAILIGILILEVMHPNLGWIRY